ncbi:traf6-b [Symbiodinium natans]|uniref:Traf6-b protein n=1 Tax=Symbiodinium natans TaxID=878477 RepID=A0A812UGE5_9DINO|nr:traf6-b [Symbiodinium natans]
MAAAVFIVSGAGGVGASVNGVYSCVGTLNGKSKYQLQDGRAILYYHDFWKINYRDDESGWYYSHPDEKSESPPLGEWTTEGYFLGNAEPAPTVAVELMTQELWVSGAGGVGCTVNGLYTLTESLNGRPKYQQVNGRAIMYFNEHWKLNYRDDVSGWYYQHPDASSETPPNGYWTTEGYFFDDADPPPVVACTTFEDASQQDTVLRCARLSVRVRRGPDWCWNQQDGGAGHFGVTIERLSATPGWVGVLWDTGDENNYRVGHDDSYDLVLVTSFRVAGAGGVGEFMNGDYVQFDTFNDRPRYRLHGGDAILFFEDNWKLGSRHEVGWYYWHPNAASKTPPTGPWSMASFFSNPENDMSPAPSVSEIHEVIEASGGEVRQGKSSDTIDNMLCGHDEEWENPEEAQKSKCSVCLCVARDALSHGCGELFCEACWMRCQAEDEKCPVCRQDGSANVAPAYANRRAILNLMMLCPNKCGQSFSLREKDSHLSECAPRTAQQHAPVICELCGDMVPADGLARHMESNPGKHMAALLMEVGRLRSEVVELKSRLAQHAGA